MFVRKRSVLSALAGALTASALLLPACSESADGDSPAVDGAGAAAGAIVAGGETSTVPIDPSNPAWALGVRSYRIDPQSAVSNPATSVLYVSGYALGEGGDPNAWLYNVWFELRLDAVHAWVQRSMQDQGSVGTPTAEEAASFAGRLNATSFSGAPLSGDQIGTLVGGMALAIRSRAPQLAAAGPGAATALGPRPAARAARAVAPPQGRQPVAAAAAAPAEAAPLCLAENELRDNTDALTGSVFACTAELAVGIGAGFALGPIWGVAFVVFSSLGGGVGCGNIYGLVCDREALYYRQDCCRGWSDHHDTFAERTTSYRLMCPFGDPIPEPSECADPKPYCVKFTTHSMRDSPYDYCDWAAPWVEENDRYLGVWDRKPDVALANLDIVGNSCHSSDSCWIVGGEWVNAVEGGVTGTQGGVPTKVSWPPGYGHPQGPINYTNTGTCGSYIQTTVLGDVYVCE